MKKASLLFLTAILTCSSFAQKTTFNVKKVSLTKWNTTDGIYYTQVPGANLGATSFEVINSKQIAFLCNSKSEIAIINTINGKVTKRFSVSFAPRDFVFDNNLFYVLSEYKVAIYNQSGIIINTIDFNRTYVGVERISRYNNSTYLVLPSGNSVLIETSGKKVEPKELEGRMTSTGSQVSPKLEGENNYKLLFRSPLGNQFQKSFTVKNKIAGVFVIDATANRVIIDVQSYLSESPIKVERKIVSIEISETGFGEIKSEIKIPDVYYVLSNKDFSVTPKGTLYNMLATPEGVFIYSLVESRVGKSYPKTLQSSTYNSNEHLMRIEEK